MSQKQTTIINFKKGFNPKEILDLSQEKKKLKWVEKGTKKEIYVRSPLMQVVFPPTPVKGRASEYSMSLRVYIGDKKEKCLEKKQMFKDLVEHAIDTSVNFFANAKNSSVFAKKEFTSKDDFEVASFWYNEDTFYIRFRGSTPSFDVDHVKTKENGKLTVSPIKNGLLDLLGEGTLLFVDLQPNIFFFHKKNTLYPFSLNAEKLVVARSKKNTGSSMMSTKSHGALEGYALDIPAGYKLPEELEKQTDVPIISVDEFDINKYSLSKLKKDKKDRDVIYSRYGDSFGRTYFKAQNEVVKYDPKPDTEYGNRNLVFASCEQNETLNQMVQQ